MAQDIQQSYKPSRLRLQRLSRRVVLDFRHNRTLYLLVLPVIAYYIIFRYFPIGGVAIAFKD